ncbi:MAG: cation diffusion facilitator family transporter, partial [Geminicoccaceae bacterium]
MIAEVVGGLISGSLALLADAGHMLSDFASLVLAWFAFHIAKRPATQALSYGTDRFQVLAAFVNGMTLIFLCLWIFVEAVQRFLAPVDILSGTMMAIAILGLLVNVTAFLILSSADKDNLNIRGAMMHVVGDIFGSIATIAAAGMIMVTGWTVADPILSLLVVALILRGAYYIVKDSGHILLEGTPAFLDPEDIERDLTDNVDDLEDVH